MRFFNLARVALSAVALCALTACGGGGDDNSSSTAYASLTLVTPSSSNPAGTYQANGQEKYIDATPWGTLYSFEFNTASLSAGFSYIKEDPSYYLVGFADDSGEYLCASAPLAIARQGALPTCPSSVQVDMRSKTVTLNNTTLFDVDGLAAPPVTVSGTIHWD